MKSNKRVDIELMRIIAAFFVIFNHTGTTGFFVFSLCDTQSIQYWLYLFVSIFCRFSVPLFLMIAGALMLNRQGETIKKLWIHRVLHIAFILVFWSFLYYMNSVMVGEETFNIYHFFSQLYDSNWNYSYWYLYLYIAFLISLPLLQRFAQSLTDKEYIYIYLVYVIFQMIIPCMQYLLFQGKHNLNGNLSVGWLTSSIVIFPLTGYFLSFRKKEFWNKKRILILWMINIVTIVLSSYLTYYRAKVTGICDERSSQTFHSTFVWMNCVAIFITCQYLNEHSHLLTRLAKPISALGGCTFGAYLMHAYILSDSKLNGCLWHIFREKFDIPSMLYAFILCGVVLIIGCIVTMILKKIPVLRRLVS